MRQLLLLTFIVSFISSNILAQVPNYVPTANLVGYWPLTSTLGDLSGSSNVGTGNSYTYTNDRFGTSSSAGSLSGGNSYIQFSNLPVNTDSDYTINYWMKLNAYQAYNVISDFHPSNSCGNYMQVWEYTDTVYMVKCNIVSSKMALGYKAKFLNTWRMITFSIKSDTTRIYIDGQLLSKFPYAWDPSTTSNLIIGNNYTGSAQYNNGANVLMDDIGLWRRPLNNCEISNLFSTSILGITNQPANQSGNIGSSVIFSVAASSPNVTYQWQISNGTGYVNLNNGGQYNGVNTSTLVVSNLTIANANQFYNCIVTNGTGCTAVSDKASITIISTAVAGNINVVGYSLSQNFPNPLDGSAIIDYYIGAIKNSANVLFFDVLGRKIKSEQILRSGEGKLKINKGEFGPGVYYYSLYLDGVKMDTKKMIVR